MLLDYLRQTEFPFLQQAIMAYEMICLIWFDGTEEPELWVYDCNGESRYKDLAAYLQAYIDDDVSASEVKWKLADM